MFVHGRGHRKTTQQRHYEKLREYTAKLEEYVEKIKICGENRNSYSKTDHSATFMRIKTDYMGNDQLLPAYNVQVGVADEYIAVVDVNQYRSDMDCFVPLMNKFYTTYGFYPKYPVADAGYGSYNNYIFCEQHGIEKYMKFPMFKKETTDKKYHEDPFRAVNFPIGEDGIMRCPNGKNFYLQYRKNVKGNKYGRQEEVYQCEDCFGCPYAEQCKKTDKNRTVRLNRELTVMHQEVIENLESIQGALLRMNRSIQAEGTFGIIKNDRWYKRIVRRGIKSVMLEVFLVSIGHNLYKYHNKQKKIATDKGIYLMPSDIVSALARPDAFSCAYSNPYLANSETLNSITMNYKGKKYEMTLTKKKKKKKSSDLESSYDYTAYVDGRKVDSDSFIKAYKAFASLSYSAAIDKNVKVSDDKEIASIEFKQDKKNVKLRFLSYNDSFYRIDVDGTMQFVVDKAVVDKDLGAFVKLK